ncbi:aldehyde dehydrogenase [Peribacillus sp. SCS-37]|uniref:aldehyde dehydrogenase n=1 Tax=Paraperibacillus esterisolvens TaxID=3115296 RepID=UPI0039063CC6
MTKIDAVFNKQRELFNAQNTKSLHFRMDQLVRLKKVLKDHEHEIFTALYTDLNKSETEAYMTELGILYSEIDFTLRNLKKWMKAKRVRTPVTHNGSRGYIMPEPYGTALIIAPWNYPVQLALSPLIGSMAAGNTSIIKPSELTPQVSAVLKKMIGDAFPEHYIAVIEGGVETSKALLERKLDYIFFTGSVRVGKAVMEAASRNLIPVTLELGGKSPCIVAPDADLKLAAKRIVFGKYTNAGQTCIAPDYLFVHRDIKEQLLKNMVSVIREFYGENPISSDKYGKIVNTAHFNRMVSYLGQGRILAGGRYDKDSRRMEPSLLGNVSWDSPVMQQEIFGPVFPVLEFDSLDEVILEVNKRPKPLALYLFTSDRDTESKIMDSISFGGGCVNDTLMQIATPYLPFGGVGESGMGSYHGASSFHTFTHYKSVLKQTSLFDFSFKYPSAKNGMRILRRLLK